MRISFYLLDVNMKKFPIDIAYNNNTCCVIITLSQELNKTKANQTFYYSGCIIVKRVTVRNKWSDCVK